MWRKDCRRTNTRPGGPFRRLLQRFGRKITGASTRVKLGGVQESTDSRALEGEVIERDE